MAVLSTQQTCSMTKISRLGGFPAMKTPQWQPHLPLSRSCQTPKVIDPSVIITTAVMLRNSKDKLLSDGPVLSIMVHKQLIRICFVCFVSFWVWGGGRTGFWPRPLSRSCQTPKVINPSVIITAVVLRNSKDKLLSDGPVLSITVHKQLIRICFVFVLWGGGGGGDRLLTEATISFVPDSESHKPKRNNNNAIAKINCSLMALSCQSWFPNSWYVCMFCLFVCLFVFLGGGNRLLTEATCWSTGQGKNHSSEIGVSAAQTRDFPHAVKALCIQSNLRWHRAPW